MKEYTPITYNELLAFNILKKLQNDNVNLAMFNTHPEYFNTIYPKHNNKCEYCGLTDTEILKNGHAENCQWIELATDVNKLKNIVDVK